MLTHCIENRIYIRLTLGVSSLGKLTGRVDGDKHDGRENGNEADNDEDFDESENPRVFLLRVDII